MSDYTAAENALVKLAAEITGREAGLFREYLAERGAELGLPEIAAYLRSCLRRRQGYLYQQAHIDQVQNAIAHGINDTFVRAHSDAPDPQRQTQDLCDRLEAFCHAYKIETVMPLEALDVARHLNPPQRTPRLPPKTVH